MEIISVPFALLAIASIFLYYLLNNKYRIGYLVILSCFFIASHSYYFLIYVVLYSLLNYLIGIKIPESRNKKTLFRAGIIINLLQLVLLKYASFSVDPIFQLFGSSIQISKLSEIFVPIGISFFTLQGIGYLINIKMEWEKPERRFPDFLLYMIFYPKFISGPIERSNHFLPQIKVGKVFDEQQVTEGLRIALFGFFKKVVIANQLGILVNGAYSDLSTSSTVTLLLVILIQPLYLYFDFSGYTDIAIGFAKAFGIDLLPNFNRPFLSENVTSFWKRMHMSLSLWFNDYVFRQASFRYRKWGKYASVFAVFLTFTLFGIWHGAGWNFMILGFLQALAINYEFFTKKKRVAIFSKMPYFYIVWFGRVVTYLFFGISTVFFFAPDLKTAIHFFSELNSYGSLSLIKPLSNLFLIALGFALFFLVFEYLKQDREETYGAIKKFWLDHRFLRITIYFLMTFFIMTLVGKQLTFIYQMF